jgi:hypothetical protein
METVLRMPRAISFRLRTSPLLVSLAALPMMAIVVLVAVLVWISFQTGLVGTSQATYTLKNYEEILGDPFVLKVFWNTIVLRFRQPSRPWSWDCRSPGWPSEPPCRERSWSTPS